ncbi:putative asparaginase 2 [Cavenderia fasciculata]|uniref:Asparaginase 2 n=1 Tax=Cavenderia fasciculata TaxID=261658 RepID=F4Q6J8_CACFS|nr:putative asparaginase 2 [Cavenderia fasciculata]EGG16508.1 putative asparaginase 2 [Cavenderia fasciculata]|eukprot:XP_004354908.1 putative asparaginase 2 [Cavenderia fasciculata]
MSEDNINYILSMSQQQEKKKSINDDDDDLKKRYPLFIGIHVGAGYHSKKLSRSYRDVVDSCLKRSKDIVYQTLSDSDASDGQQQHTICASSIVEIVIQMLEDDPLTNAGKGSNLNFDGQVECDASLMDGQFNCHCNNNCFQQQQSKDKKRYSIHHRQQQPNNNNNNNIIDNNGLMICGGGIWAGVGAVNGITNPIRLVGEMVKRQKKSADKSLGRVRPLMLVASGAKEWAMNHSVETYDPNSLFGDPLITQQSNLTYLKHKSKLEYWKSIKGHFEQENGENEEYNQQEGGDDDNDDNQDEQLYDTVGAIVVDWNGNVAAGVSSGGISLKHPGRVGEAAIFGSGCWAQNELIIKNHNDDGDDDDSIVIPGVASSCTGTSFI